VTSRSKWRLDLAQRAIRTAERHLDAGRMEHFRRSCAFAREMLREFDLPDYDAGHSSGEITVVQNERPQ